MVFSEKNFFELGFLGTLVFYGCGATPLESDCRTYAFLIGLKPAGFITIILLIPAESQLSKQVALVLN